MYNTPSYYNYSYSYGPSTATTAGAASAIGAFFVFFIFLLVAVWVILTIIAEWKIFVKAGKEGWKCLIPIYNAYTMLQILNMEPMLCFLTIIPYANFFLNIVMQVKLAKSFKKGVGFAIGLILLGPIFLMILGFGSAKYTQLPSSK